MLAKGVITHCCGLAWARLFGLEDHATAAEHLQKCVDLIQSIQRRGSFGQSAVRLESVRQRGCMEKGLKRPGPWRQTAEKEMRVPEETRSPNLSRSSVGAGLPAMQATGLSVTRGDAIAASSSHLDLHGSESGWPVPPRLTRGVSGSASCSTCTGSGKRDITLHHLLIAAQDVAVSVLTSLRRRFQDHL